MKPRPIGITQVSEIIATPGVDLVGLLPTGFELATIYSVAVCTRAREAALARRFAQLLAGPQTPRGARAAAGFEMTYSVLQRLANLAQLGFDPRLVVRPHAQQRFLSGGKFLQVPGPRIRTAPWAASSAIGPVTSGVASR